MIKFVGILWDTLQDTGFSLNLALVIMHCISTSSMQLKWNGQLIDVFLLPRELRRGNPLSPYLFVLGIEWLGQLIDD